MSIIKVSAIQLTNFETLRTVTALILQISLSPDHNYRQGQLNDEHYIGAFQVRAQSKNNSRRGQQCPGRPHSNQMYVGDR